VLARYERYHVFGILAGLYGVPRVFRRANLYNIGDRMEKFGRFVASRRVALNRIGGFACMWSCTLSASLDGDVYGLYRGCCVLRSLNPFHRSL
jgi:hypothetical protein